MLYVVCAVSPLISLLSPLLQDAQSSGASRVNLESSQGSKACQLINFTAIMHCVVVVWALQPDCSAAGTLCFCSVCQLQVQCTSGQGQVPAIHFIRS